MKFPIGAMSVGDILDRGQKLLFARFPVLFFAALLIQLPLIALQLVVPYITPSNAAGVVLLTFGVLVLYMLILTPIVRAISLRVVMQEYVDQPVTFGEAFSSSLARFGPLLGSVILYGVLVFLSFFACVIPSIYLSIAWAFVAQVVVLEGLGGMDALNRSKQLVAGHWWRVFGVLFLIGVVTAVISNLVQYAVGAALPPYDQVPGPFGRPIITNFRFGNYAVGILAMQIAQVFFAAYSAVCVTLLYLDLRIRKEGFDLEIEAQKQAAPAAELP